MDAGQANLRVGNQELETTLNPWLQPHLLWGPIAPTAQICRICEHLLEAFLRYEMLPAHL